MPSMTADALFRLKAHNDTNASFATAGKNLQRLEESARKVDRVFAGMRGMEKAAAMIGKIAGGGVILGAVKGVISAGDEIGDMADATGFGVESIQSLMIVARDAGVRLDRLKNTIGDLRGKMDEARVEGGEKLAAAFAKLGVTADMLAKGDVEGVFERIAGALKAGAGDATVTAAAHDVLGSSVEKLGPVFAAAAEGLAKLNAQMIANGEIMSSAQVKALSNTDRAIQRFQNQRNVVTGGALLGLDELGAGIRGMLPGGPGFTEGFVQRGIELGTHDQTHLPSFKASQAAAANARVNIDPNKTMQALADGLREGLAKSESDAQYQSEMLDLMERLVKSNERLLKGATSGGPIGP